MSLQNIESENLGEHFMIRRAAAVEEDIVLDILGDVATWLRGRGIEQWPERFPRESVQTQIEEGDAYLIFRNDDAVATVVITDAEPSLWGDENDQALHISRLAVDRRIGGQGLGHAILKWVEIKARECDRMLVRLATSPQNSELRRYYEEFGYLHCGDLENAKWPTSLYEKKLQS